MLDVAVVVVVGEPWGRVEGKGKGRWGEIGNRLGSVHREGRDGGKERKFEFFPSFSAAAASLSHTHTFF